MPRFLLTNIEYLSEENEEQLLGVAADSKNTDSMRLAAALLLTACESNERKAED